MNKRRKAWLRERTWRFGTPRILPCTCGANQWKTIAKKADYNRVKMVGCRNCTIVRSVSLITGQIMEQHHVR